MTRTSRSIPDDTFVLVIGAMKSGTTTFYAHLTSHPAIAGSRVNETPSISLRVSSSERQAPPPVR